MKRRGIVIILIVSVILIAICYLPKFHKPPVEFMSKEFRLLIEITFFVSIITFIISVLILLKKGRINFLYLLFTIVVIGFSIVGIFFSIINSGNTYQDKEIYVNKENGEEIIFQYYGHGGLGSTSRYIKVKNKITDKIRLINYVDFDEIKGEWDIFDLQGNFIKTKNIKTVYNK